MLDDEKRSELKLQMMLALGDPTSHTAAIRESREQVLEDIKTGGADLLVSALETGQPARHYAIRFADRTLGEATREDCLDLYRLR